MCDWLVKVNTHYGTKTHIEAKYKDYKWTDDYHNFLEKRMKKLIKYMKTDEFLDKYNGNSPPFNEGGGIIKFYHMSCDMRSNDRGKVWREYSRESRNVLYRRDTKGL